MGKTREPQSSNSPLCEIQPADTKLKTKKKKKQSESNTGTPVGESPVDYNQPDEEQKTIHSSELQESSLLSLSELPEPEQVSSESLKNIKSVSEPISGLQSELLESVPGEPISGSQSELSSVSYDNYPKTPTVNSELPSESLSNSHKIKENQNSDAMPHSLSGAALARRLDVSPSTLRHKKNARNFGKWTKGHDPDGIAWHYDGKKFIPTTSQ